MIRNIHTFFTLFLVIFLIGCANSEKEESGNKQQNDDRIKISKSQFEENTMSFGSLEEKSIPVSIEVNGMIDVPPENRAVVNSTMGGYIKTTPLLVGDVVKKGQVVVTLENPEFISMQQRYMEVKEQLNYLKTEFERQKTMFEENITSQKNYLKSESNYKTAIATYNGLRKQLLMLNILPSNVEKGNITSIVTLYAPISGSITKVNVTRGTYVSPATSIIEIVDNSHIHLELSVFEKDILKVKKGQKINFKITEASNETFKAEVYLVGTTIDENRTIKVHGHPLDESVRFLTGMFVNAEIITSEKQSKVLPDKGIVEIENEFYVLVLDKDSTSDYRFNQVKVAIGNSANGYTEIIENSNITEVDKILVDGAFNLLGIE